MTNSVTIFAKKLKKQLKSGSVSVLTLSRITGVSHQAIYKYSSGEIEAGLGNADKIANALGYTLAEFISDKPNSVHTVGDCLESIQQALHNRTRK